MSDNNRSTAIALTLLAGIIIQVCLSIADSKETPLKTALNFCKSYLMIESSMSDYVSSDLKGTEEAGAVAIYINKAESRAENLGFEQNYLRKHLYEADAHLISADKDSAKVKVTGTTRKYINFIFTVVGKFFFIGNTDPFEKTVTLVKEKGHWKVCGDGFF